MFRKSDTKYRQEGLSMMQISRMNDGRRDDSSKLLIAGLSVVAVGCLAYVSVQKVSNPVPPQAVAILSEPAPRPAQPDTVDPVSVAVAAQTPAHPEADLGQPTQTEVAMAPQIMTPTPDPDVAEIEPEVVVAAVDLSPSQEEESLEVLQATVAPEPLAPATSCFNDLQTAAVSSTIFFGSGSAQLTGKDLAVLTRIGRLAENCNIAKVQITGHSDTTGNDLTNLNLSWQRADNTLVAIEQLGYDASKFEPVGFGARTPLSQGDASDDELNRRVEFIILPDTKEN